MSFRENLRTALTFDKQDIYHFCEESFMKVLITTDLYVTETNGVVTSVRNLREELVKNIIEYSKTHPRIKSLNLSFKSW